MPDLGFGSSEIHGHHNLSSPMQSLVLIIGVNTTLMPGELRQPYKGKKKLKER